MRLVVLILFLAWRVSNPNYKAYGLWLVSVICETWFGVSWILDQVGSGPLKEQSEDGLMEKASAAEKKLRRTASVLAASQNAICYCGWHADHPLLLVVP